MDQEQRKTPSIELGVLGRNRVERQSELLGWHILISNQDGDQGWVVRKRTCVWLVSLEESLLRRKVMQLVNALFVDWRRACCIGLCIAIEDMAVGDCVPTACLVS